MDYEEFEELLKKADISKKEFASYVDMNYVSITNWNKNKIPPWVKSWLENYIKAKSYNDVKNKVLEIEGIK